MAKKNGRVSSKAVSAFGLSLALLVATTTLAGASTLCSVGIYSQNSNQQADCWATTWGKAGPSPQCRNWSQSLQTGLPSDTSLQQDFCMNYGQGAREMNQPSTADLSGVFGFQTTSSNYQRIDPVTGSGCGITGTSSRWGMALHGTSSNGFCVPVNCGIMHLLNWTTMAVRPFQGAHSLAYGARFGVVSDNVGWPVAQSIWHGFICPALHDTRTGQGFLLCQETWRSDPGADAFCHQSYSTLDGSGICLDGPKVTAIMASGGNGGFREFIGPDPGGDYGIVWTRPEAGSKLATSTAGSFKNLNQFGAQRYEMTVSPDQLRRIVGMFNLALSIDHERGQYLNVAPMSTRLGDWALTSLQVGAEGNSLNQSPSAMIGVTSSNLMAKSF